LKVFKVGERKLTKIKWSRERSCRRGKEKSNSELYETYPS